MCLNSPRENFYLFTAAVPSFSDLFTPQAENCSHAIYFTSGNATDHHPKRVLMRTTGVRTLCVRPRLKVVTG